MVHLIKSILESAVNLHATCRLDLLNLIGAHYRLSPLESIHPINLLLGLFPAWVLPFIFGACTVWLVLSMVRLGIRIADSAVPGVVAAFLLLFSNTTTLEYVALSPMAIYLALVLAALNAHLAGREKASAVYLLLGGLCRPEVWAIAVIFAVYHIWKIRQIWPVTLVPLAAPAIWMLIVHRISTASAAGQIHAFTTMNLLTPMKWTDFFGAIWACTGAFNLTLMLLGTAGLVAMMSRAVGSIHNIKAIAAVIAGVIGFYFISTAVTGNLLFPRFFIVPAALLYLCAAILVSSLCVNRTYLILASIALCCFTFTPKCVMDPIEGSIKGRNGLATVEYLSQWMRTHELPAGRILVYPQDLYSLMMSNGEKSDAFSRRTINMGEAIKNRSLEGVSTIVYTYGDDHGAMGYFGPLSIPEKATIFGKTFAPVYVAKNRLGVIYEAVK